MTDEIFETHIEINTYRGLLLFSDIGSIIITDKNKGKGYIKINGLYNKFNDKHTLIKHIKNKKLYRNHTYLEDKLYDLKFNFKNIIYDVYEKCYRKVKIKKLKYNDVIIIMKEIYSCYNICCLLDTKCLIYNNITWNNNDDKIIYTTKNPKSYFSKPITDYNLNINYLMFQLLRNNELIENFNNLTKSIFVKKEEVDVFYDYENYILTRFLCNLIDKTSIKYLKLSYFNTFDDFKNTLKRDGENVRLVIIDKFQEEEVIEFLHNKNIFNIIFQGNDKKIYYQQELIEYLKMNSKNIFDKCRISFKSIDDFFNDLDNVFLSWCCKTFNNNSNDLIIDDFSRLLENW